MRSKKLENDEEGEEENYTRFKKMVGYFIDRRMQCWQPDVIFACFFQKIHAYQEGHKIDDVVCAIIEGSFKDL